MSSRVSYPLQASSRAIDPQWAQDQYGWAYDVLTANGISDEDTRWEFAATEHGLHPLTYHGWWMFVVYYDNRLGVVVDSERIRTLRAAYPEGSVEVCGQSINNLLWVLFDTNTIALQEIQQELEYSIKVLQSSKAVSPRGNRDSLILLWNPDNWTWPTLKEHIATSRNGQAVRLGWKVKNANLVHIGMPAYMYRTGTKGRGFMASGYVVSPPYVTSHFSGDDEQQTSVDVIFDTIFDPANDPLLMLDEINSLFPDTDPIPNFLHSGVVLRDETAERVHKVWLNHVRVINGNGTEFESVAASNAEYFYAEGALRQLSVNAHERSGLARERAIAIHGTDCRVCGINFERTYGDFGKGFIHIHHVDPIANAVENRPVDPRHDLVPVCPNCHAMLHRRNPPFTTHELAQMMAVQAERNSGDS